MSHANLTARYRPQTFADIAGQETVRTILSRAAAEDRVAPAYLFSGTRGVGKTTIARVFAKALNCAHAPAAEPCNACERCRQITLGTAVDVVEIDGASNRGIDDVRRLKEVVGYAPMDGRYKIFIIDEAHMLSRDAFNALLKTLEEPPANVTFILATTEPHKFPATILSRCQHYVFKRLSEQGLEAHLTKVLTAESVPFEESAVRLLTRRAAGSVRDAMSLLGQVLALGGEKLTEADARGVLGLAGQELLFSLMGHLRGGDTAAIVGLVREMLDSGLDLGFFLRELALAWRTMFILRQAGDAAALDLPAAEAARWRDEAALFGPAHIHAAWQMTLEGQRRVLTSLEPALALELLLLNIAMLPRLLPREDLSRMVRPGGGAAAPAAPSAPGAGSAASGPNGSPGPDTARAGESRLQKSPSPAQPPVPDAPAGHADAENRSAGAEVSAPDAPGPASAGDFSAGRAGVPEDCSWQAFLRFCGQRQDLARDFMGMVRTLTGAFADGVLAVTPSNSFAKSQLEKPETWQIFAVLARDYYGSGTALEVLPPPPVKSPAEIREEVRAHPAVRLLEEEMGARLVDYGVSRGNAEPLQ